MTLVTNCLRGAEMVGKYSGYDIDGLSEDLLKDPDFIMDLQLISCEIDLSKYIDPKKAVFLKILKKAYEKRHENNIKNNVNNFLNDPEKINRIKNININKS